MSSTGPTTPVLRLTRRALEDLGLGAEHVGRPADTFRDAHPVVESFVRLRSQDAHGQEVTHLPVTEIPVDNLHSGRWRGLTWHDEEENVVWLLGVGWHEGGSAKDAYAILKRRDELGNLFPTDQDYVDCEPDPLDFVRSVSEQAKGSLRKRSLSA